MAYNHSSKRYITIAIFYFTVSALFFKQSDAQVFAWARQIGGSTATSSTSMGQIQIDAAGNIYQTISSASPIDVDPGSGVINFTGDGIIKLSPAGNFIWVRQIPSPFVLDGSGNIYATGSFSATKDFDPGPDVYNLTSFGYNDVFIVKFDVSGNLLWAKQVGGNYAESSGGITFIANKIVLSGGFGYGGNISPINSCDFDPDPVATYSLTNVGGWDGFILTLDPDGQFISVIQKGTMDDDSIGPICVDNNGDIIYRTGTRLEKSDPANNVLWSFELTGIAYSMAPITIDANNNILISGGYMGTFDIDPGPGVTMVPSVTMSGSVVQAPFVEKFDANGNFLWVKTLHANGFANGVTSDAAGNIYTVGYFNYNGNVDFDPGPGSYTFKVSALAGYIQKLSQSGDFLWAARIGGETKTRTFGRAIAVNNTNEVYTAMEFSGTIDVNPGSAKLNLKAIGNRDVLFHKMTQSNLPAQRIPEIIVSEFKSNKVVSTYPNPSNGNFYIDVPVVGDNALLEIYSMAGQLIARRSFNGKYEQRLFHSHRNQDGRNLFFAYNRGGGQVQNKNHGSIDFTKPKLLLCLNLLSTIVFHSPVSV